MNRKRVLIVRLSSLGDIIFNLPLASVLKKAGYFVAWITTEKGIDVIKDNPLVDEAIFVPYQRWKTQPFYKNIQEYFAILKYIRSKHFDIVIDTQLLFKSFIWTAFSGGKRRIVSKSAREFAQLGGNEYIEEFSGESKAHAIDNYLKYAKYLNLNTDKYDVKLPLSTPDSKIKIDNFFSNLNKEKLTIVICPATTWIPKHWNRENWKILIKLLEKDFNLVFTGNSKDYVLINYISSGNHLNLAGQTTTQDLVEIFRRVDLVVSLDSGSTHLAWATQHPKILSIFCCTPMSLYAPKGDSKKYDSISGNLRCQPCHKRVCPLKTNKNYCTMRPPVQEVYEKIQELITVRK